MPVRKAVSLALSTVVLTSATIAATAGSAPATATSPVAAPTVASSTVSGEVTLITGDRVRVSPDGSVTVVSKHRPGVHISSYLHAGHAHIVPSDAAPLLASGRLDRRLFDVTTLLESGYHSGRGSLPLVVVPDSGATSAARSLLTSASTRVGRDLPAVRGVAVEASQAAPGAAWSALTTPAAHGRALRPGVKQVWLDGVRRVMLDQSVPRVGAPSAWAAGFDGTGTRVAVIDSGIDATHPDLTGKVVAAQNFTTEPSAADLNGHGTHVASTVAGTGAASGGANRGVAPGASLLDAKVCVQAGTCSESAILAGMQWAAQQGVDVVNMSIGGPDTAGVDPVEQAVNTLTASHGTLFVIAAGNTGPTDYSVSSPGSADAALTVGAVDAFDGPAGFSSRGPRLGDAALKPDISAPGVDITAARSSTSGLPGGAYTDLSGTSMATPHVAGAAAILAQRRPTWTPAQLKAGLMGSAAATPWTGAFVQGAGLLQVNREINQTVLASPPSISLGRQVAPHADDPVLTRTVTYRNMNTSGSVALTLTLNAQNPSGSPAPAGMFSLNTTTLNLAPGGTGSVTLTTDTRVAGPEGLYGGWITATGGAGAVTVSTPFGVHRADGAEITFHLRNRAGQYVANGELVLAPVSSGIPPIQLPVLPAGPVTLWVPAGVYLFSATVPEDASLTTGATVMINPRLVVSSATPTTMNLDAAGGALVNVTVPNASAQQVMTEAAGQLFENGTVVVTGHNFVSDRPVYTRQLGSGGTVPGFIAKLRRSLGVEFNGFYNRMYDLAWFPTQFPTGFTRNVTAGELATVQAAHLPHGTGTPTGTGGKATNAQPATGQFRIGILAEFTFPMPSVRTELYNTEAGVRWQQRFSDRFGTTTPHVDVDTAPTAYTAGLTTQEVWNRPVYGPTLGALGRPDEHVVRNGDSIVFYPPLLGDNEGRAGNPSFGATGQLTLKRGSDTLATAPYPSGPGLAVVNVAPEVHTYTLEATMDRTASPAELSTRVDAVWTFRSGRVEFNQFTRLPLWYVLFRPLFNASNSTPAATTFSVPLTAAAQATSSPGTLSGITVQYSINDGATWTDATLSGSGTSRTARVIHPSGSGYVSLRATVTDSAGNAVTQTVIRAYKFG